MGRAIQVNETRNQTEVDVISSDTMDFKTAKIRREKNYFIVIKQVVHQKNINILNIYLFNRGIQFVKTNINRFNDTN